MDNFLKRFYGGGATFNADPSFGVYIEDMTSSNKNISKINQYNNINSPFNYKAEDIENNNSSKIIQRQLASQAYDNYIKDLNNNIKQGKNTVPKSFDFEDEYKIIPKIKSPQWRHGPQEAIKLQILEQRLLNMEKQHNEDKQILLDIINNNILNIKPNPSPNNNHNTDNKKINTEKTHENYISNHNKKKKHPSNEDKELNLIEGLNEKETHSALRELKKMKDELKRIVENEEERGYLKRKEFEIEIKKTYTDLMGRFERIDENRKYLNESIKYILLNSGSNRVKGMTKRLFGDYVPNISNAPKEIRSVKGIDLNNSSKGGSIKNEKEKEKSNQSKRRTISELSEEESDMNSSMSS